jgi:NADP-dependent 3-hydroxy acid dehydrogenase YdfG
MSGIEGKVVAIAGGSGGIGEATAILLADRGATVVLGARGEDRLQPRLHGALFNAEVVGDLRRPP